MSVFFTRSRPVEARAVNVPWSRGDDVLSQTSMDAALSLIPFYAAVKLISDQIATMPLHRYARNGDGSRTRMPPPAAIARPVGGGTTVDWIQRPLLSMLVRGNAYGLGSGFVHGRPTGVSWLHPDHVAWHNGQWYVKGRPLTSELQMLHIPAVVVPGQREGISPISAFAQTLDTGLEQQRGARQWARNRQVPGLTVKNTAKTLKPGEAEKVSERMRARLRHGEPFVTGNDWDLDVLQIPPGDAAFLASIKATATQIASVFNLPPEKIGGETGSSMTYATVEQQSIELLTFGLRPWMVRFEQAVSDYLLPRAQYVKFNADALMRVDTKTRHEIYAIDRSIGLHNVDELRVLEDEQPLPDGQGQDYTPLRGAASQSSSTGGGA